jgi:hypothetical protein
MSWDAVRSLCLGSGRNAIGDVGLVGRFGHALQLGQLVPRDCMAFQYPVPTVPPRPAGELQCGLNP